ncbi:MAG: radical SAM protein, partial [Pseudomonadota bacterium]
ELEAFRRLDAPATFLLDAGLNLNARGFRNLVAAQEATGWFSDSLLWAEIYPTVVKDEHVEFLRGAQAAYLGVGLQSIDPAVLKAHDRPFDMSRFRPAVERLSEVAELEVQIIFGLPGDTPEGFRRTLDFALSLPVWSVRAYHCLVLPDALLTRSRPEWRVRFDPETLLMRSNDGWSKVDIALMRQELTELSAKLGGRAGDLWWSFRPNGIPAEPAA